MNIVSSGVLLSQYICLLNFMEEETKGFIPVNPPHSLNVLPEQNR